MRWRGCVLSRICFFLMAASRRARFIKSESEAMISGLNPPMVSSTSLLHMVWQQAGAVHTLWSETSWTRSIIGRIPMIENEVKRLRQLDIQSGLAMSSESIVVKNNGVGSSFRPRDMAIFRLLHCLWLIAFWWIEMRGSSSDLSISTVLSVEQSSMITSFQFVWSWSMTLWTACLIVCSAL